MKKSKPNSALNSPKPYEFSLSANGAERIFVTDNKLIYQVYFTEGDGYFSDYSPEIATQFLMMGFACLSDTQNSVPQDERIVITIVEILKDFFAKNHKALLYVCNTSDNRQLFRSRLFTIWFNKYAVNTPIEKIDEVLEANGLILPYSLLISRLHPNYQVIKDTFNTLSMSYKNKL